MPTLLNTSILTDFGNYSYKELSLDEVKEALKETCPYCWTGCPQCMGYGFLWTFSSAIGHGSTAKILTKLLGVEVPVNRQLYKQKTGEKAIVFKLNGRPPEGKILTEKEIEEIGYTFGVLEKL